MTDRSLHFIRHGHSKFDEWNIDRMYLDGIPDTVVLDADVPLTDIGVQQAMKLGSYLACLLETVPIHLLRFHCSPWIRAQQTMAIALEEFNRIRGTAITEADVNLDDRLTDQKLGLTEPYLVKENPELGIMFKNYWERRLSVLGGRIFEVPIPDNSNLIEQMLKDGKYAGLFTPRGENLLMVIERLRTWLIDKVGSANDFYPTHDIVICHSGIQYASLVVCAGYSIDQLAFYISEPSKNVNNCSITTYKLDAQQWSMEGWATNIFLE